MAFKGGVPVNSGFYPRNDFPIADAKDIYVSDEKRLNVALDEIQLKIGTIPEGSSDVVSMIETLSEEKIGNPKVTDEEGNVIEEATGLHALIDAKSNFSGSYNDLTDLPTDHATTSYVDTEIDTLETKLSDHTGSGDIHVTQDDKDKWNNPTYKDLPDAPNISTDEDKELVIADNAGNIVMRVDEEGVNSTDFKINGESVATKIDEIHLKISEYIKELSVLGSLISFIKGDGTSESFNTTWVGTRAEYDIAYEAKKIPVGTIVVITDEEDDDDTENAGIYSAILGTGALGYMVLG